MSEYGRRWEGIAAPLRTIKGDLPHKLRTRANDNPPKTSAELRAFAAELIAIADRWDRYEAEMKALNARSDLE